MRTQIAIFLICICLGCSAQRDNVWCFGDSAALDFSSGNPIPTFSRCNSVEASASISDSSGHLIFYASGDENNSPWLTSVFNKNQDTLQNGTGLIGSTSSTNGLIIIPFPASNSKYYIFSTDGLSLYTNIIDMSLNNGSGAVIQKNILV